MKKMNKKLGFEILKYLVLVLGLTFIAIFGFIAKTSYDSAVKRQEDISMTNAVTYAEDINKKMAALQSTIDAVESELIYLKNSSMTRGEKIRILGNIMMSNPDIVGGGILLEPNSYDGQDGIHVNTAYSDETGRFLPYYSKDSSGNLVIGPLTDYNGSDWYEKPKSLRKTYATKPYEYEVNGKVEQMITVSNVVEDGSTYIGVITADITLGYLENYLKNISNQDVFYGVVSSDDIILAHGLDSSNVGTTYTQKDTEHNTKALEKIKLGESFVGISNSESGSKELRAFAPIKFVGVDDSYWSLISVTSVDYINSQFNATLVKLIAIGLIIILLVTFVLNFIINIYVIKPINKVKSVLEEIADYDFEVERRDKDPEIGKIVSRGNELSLAVMAMRNMVVNINELLKQISAISQNLAATAQELTATSDQTATSSEEVSKTIEEIAHGATGQASDTSNCASKVEDIGNNIEQEKQLIGELENSAVNIEKQKDEGFDVLHLLEESSVKSQESNDTVYNVVVGVNESASKIDSASQMIQSIAEQTNLLALNAAIEAARAGEAGKGFAVVAEEIRKLAEQSNGFTEDIKKVIQELISNSMQAVQTIEESKIITREQLKGVVATKEKFDKIAEAIEDTRQIIEKVGYTSNRISQNKDEIVDIMQSLSAIAEQNAASTEEASASMQQQLESIQDIAHASDNLANTAMELQDEIQKFKI